MKTIYACAHQGDLIVLIFFIVAIATYKEVLICTANLYFICVYRQKSSKQFLICWSIDVLVTWNKMSFCWKYWHASWLIKNKRDELPLTLLSLEGFLQNYKVNAIHRIMRGQWIWTDWPCDWRLLSLKYLEGLMQILQVVFLQPNPYVTIQMVVTMDLSISNSSATVSNKW